ncbi:uncharacterized protein LOC144173189 isoform X1 [Haemaphysalis longicornis]
MHLERVHRVEHTFHGNLLDGLVYAPLRTRPTLFRLPPVLGFSQRNRIHPELNCCGFCKSELCATISLPVHSYNAPRCTEVGAPVRRVLRVPASGVPWATVQRPVPGIRARAGRSPAPIRFPRHRSLHRQPRASGPPAHAPGGTLPPPLAGGPWPPSHSPMVPPVGSVPPYGGPSPPPPMGPAVLPYPAQAMPPPPPPAPPSLPVVNVEGGVGMPPSQGQRRVSLKPDVSVLTYSSADSVATTAHGTGHPPPESPLGGITLGGVVNQFLDSFTSTENVGRQQPPSTHETSQGEQRKKRKRRHQHQLDFATGPDAGIGGESSTP